ncbi:MAG: glycosyltransferase [Candidatus Obscuribacterales bacterium]|nr:glycosyltransferase [Candidatus Obscuribacterales bacterium]
MFTDKEQTLPPPPFGKVGWPWDIRLKPLGSSSPEDLPRISIVTPCLNSAPFIEECIRSVLLQGYPNLEFVIVDGGSTDGTVEIISKYQKFLLYWVSEPDKGQSAAINKGMKKCSGQLVNWLNADDILLPGALHALGTAYELAPDTVLLSPVINVDLETSKSWTTHQSLLFADVVRFWVKPTLTYHQPGIFMSSSLWNQVGGLDEDLHICMDYDLYCKIAPFARLRVVDFTTVEFRRHKGQKTAIMQDLLIIEKSQASKKYWDRSGVTAIDKKNHDNAMAQAIGSSVAGRGLNLFDSLSAIGKLCRGTGISPAPVSAYYVLGLIKNIVRPFVPFRRR